MVWHLVHTILALLWSMVLVPRKTGQSLGIFSEQHQNILRHGSVAYKDCHNSNHAIFTSRLLYFDIRNTH